MHLIWSKAFSADSRDGVVTKSYKRVLWSPVSIFILLVAAATASAILGPIGGWTMLGVIAGYSLSGSA